MENPEALGFHQETMKESTQQTEQWKIQQKPQDWFCIKLYIILVPNFASFFFLCNFRNVISTKTLFLNRENYYKFQLQNSKS